MEHNCDESIWYDYQNEKWFLRVDGSYWDERGDCFEHTDVELNYCYICGVYLNNKNK